MSLDVDNAVYSRWNAASLNSSIATLYPGEQVASPDEADMPRANYYSDSDQKESETRVAITRLKRYTFEAWGTNYETVAAYVKTMEGKYLPGENGVTPFTLTSSAGRLIETNFVDSGVDKVEDAVFRGWLIFDLRWEKWKRTLT